MDPAFSVLRYSSTPVAAAAAAAAAVTAAPSLISRRMSSHASAARISTSSKNRRGVVSYRVTTSSSRRRSVSIRCEQSAKQGGGGGADVWLGRAAMVGFASAIAVEVATGKGFLQNFGVATPAPTLALVVSGLVVGLAVFFLLQSGSGSRD